MVDEYQDTNKLQSDIVKGLSQINKNVMVVGDDSQSIYSFRGASFKNIIEFPKLFDNVKIIKLEENYRSIQPCFGFYKSYNCITQLRNMKRTFIHKKSGGELPIIIAASTENLQSKFIVEKILDFVKKEFHLKM